MNPATKKTSNKVIFIFLLLMTLSFFGILFAFYLKEENILTEQNSTPRVTLLVISFIINFFSTLVCIGVLLTNIFINRSLDFTIRKSKATYWFQFFYTIVLLPYLFFLIIFVETKRVDIELTSLKNFGITKAYRIDSVHHVPGNGSRYEYYLKGVSEDIHATRKNDILNIGDTIFIKHLPCNLSVYREIEE
jgi:hypothetical protein